MRLLFFRRSFPGIPCTTRTLQRIVKIQPHARVIFLGRVFRVDRVKIRRRACQARCEHEDVGEQRANHEDLCAGSDPPIGFIGECRMALEANAASAPQPRQISRPSETSKAKQTERRRRAQVPQEPLAEPVQSHPDHRASGLQSRVCQKNCHEKLLGRESAVIHARYAYAHTEQNSEDRTQAQGAEQVGRPTNVGMSLFKGGRHSIGLGTRGGGDHRSPPPRDFNPE